MVMGDLYTLHLAWHSHRPFHLGADLSGKAFAQLNGKWPFRLIFYTMPAEVAHFQQVAILKTA